MNRRPRAYERVVEVLCRFVIIDEDDFPNLAEDVDVEASADDT